MPYQPGRGDAARAVVFAPLDGAGRAFLVERRLEDAIVAGVLRDGERLPSESDLARSLGVAVVTAREALESLRANGLVRTRRGRDGGSFVTFDRDTARRLVDERVRRLSRIELRDLALHYRAIAVTCAEVACDRASEDDVLGLVDIDARADAETPGGARRAAGRFFLEVAALTQSSRLVHEELRLQSEVGPLLWACLRDPAARAAGHVFRLAFIDAIREGDASLARRLVREHLDAATEWLVDEKVRLEAGSVPLVPLASAASVDRGEGSPSRAGLARS